jgi:hypothetical protein
MFNKMWMCLLQSNWCANLLHLVQNSVACIYVISLSPIYHTKWQGNFFSETENTRKRSLWLEVMNTDCSFRGLNMWNKNKHEKLEIKMLKSTIFWDITPCSSLSANRHFEGTYRLHLQGRRNKFSKKPESKQMTRWRRYVPPKFRLTLNGLHGVISQNMVLIITTAVKISNPTIKMLDYSELRLRTTGARCPLTVHPLVLGARSTEKKAIPL